MTQDTKLNIDLLIEALEAETYGFDMSRWVGPTGLHPCGTAACIGGTAGMLMSCGKLPSINSIFQWITESLTLARDYHNNELFSPETEIAYWLATDPNSPLYISRERAIAVLKHLRDTGKIDWDRFDNQGEVRS